MVSASESPPRESRLGAGCARAVEFDLVDSVATLRRRVEDDWQVLAQVSGVDGVSEAVAIGSKVYIALTRQDEHVVSELWWADCSQAGTAWGAIPLPEPLLSPQLHGFAQHVYLLDAMPRWHQPDLAVVLRIGADAGIHTLRPCPAGHWPMDLAHRQGALMVNCWNGGNGPQSSVDLEN